VTARREALLAGTLVFAVGLVAVVLTLTSDHESHRLLQILVGVVLGWSFLASGLVAHTRRPDNNTGRLMVWVALAWFLGALVEANGALVYTIGLALNALVFAALAHLVLAYPAGRLQPGAERRVVAAGYTLAILGPPFTMLFSHDPASCSRCPDNLLAVTQRSGIERGVSLTIQVVAALLVLTVVVLLVRRWRAASVAYRRSVRGVLFSSGLAMALLALTFAVAPISEPAAEGLSIGAVVAFVAVPFFFLLGLLRGHFAGAAVARLLADIGPAPATGELRAALRDVLGDPTLELGYWLPALHGYVDIDGRPFEPSSHGAATLVEGELGRIGVLVHDPALLEQRELLDSVVGAARLALDNERLHAEIRARIVEVERERDFTRVVVNTAPAFFCVVDGEGRIVRFNHTLERAAGVADDDGVRGRFFWEVFAVEDEADEVRASLALAAVAGRTEPHEHTLLAPDGSRRTVVWSEVVIPDEHGQLRYVLVSGADVTERRRHEDEQAALRRVATLVAAEPMEEELLATVTSEVGRLFGAQTANMARFEGNGVHLMGGWSVPGARSIPSGTYIELDGETALARVHRTGMPARMEAYEAADGRLAEIVRELDVRSTIAAPIVVDGGLWGAVTASRTNDQRFAPDAEHRLGDFASLVAQAISNAGARNALATLAAEQAALRRVATLVAGAPTDEQLLAGVTAEVGRLFDAQGASIVQVEGPGRARVVGGWGVAAMPDFGAGPEIPFGMERGTASARALITGAPARVDSPDEVETESGRELWTRFGFRASLAAPVVVEGRLWGSISVSRTTDEPFPPGAEQRLGDFAGLVAQAVANAEARVALTRAAAEQAALRRVATLVATGPSEAELISAVSSEVAGLFDAQAAHIWRYEGEGVRIEGGWNIPAGVDSFHVPDPETLVGRIARTRAPARRDDYEGVGGVIGALVRDTGIRSAIGAPVVVDGELWGAIVISTTGAVPFAPGAEDRLGDFAALVAQALANAAARLELATLAEEQAALRRVATLVAAGRSKAEVLEVVSQEAGELFGAEAVDLMRWEGVLDEVAVIGGWSAPGATPVPAGSTYRTSRDSATIRVLETGLAARGDEPAELIEQDGRRDLGTRTAISAPVIVGGRLWGALTAMRAHGEVFPPDAEVRLKGFASLMAQAIGNAEAHDELHASRARIVQAADDARRRLERDLHDGAQQRLVSLSIALRLAQAKLAASPEEAQELLAGALYELTHAIDELRELARGIHPAVLTDRGLGPALQSLAQRSQLPVQIDAALDERLPPPVEAAAYYVVSESLANVAKYAQAGLVHVRVSRANGVARVEVEDDGVGGADPTRGSGLRGLADRVEALDGVLGVESPPAAGTRIWAEIPVV
jgi:PAS domain S-box-containing protein